MKQVWCHRSEGILCLLMLLELRKHPASQVLFQFEAISSVAETTASECLDLKSCTMDIQWISLPCFCAAIMLMLAALTWSTWAEFPTFRQRKVPVPSSQGISGYYCNVEVGERTDPCLTPRLTGKLSEHLLLTFTALCTSLWLVTSIFITGHQLPHFFSSTVWLENSQFPQW